MLPGRVRGLQDTGNFSDLVRHQALYWDFKGRLLHASRYLQLATDCMAKLLRERRNFQPGHPARLFTLCWFCDAHFALRIGYGTSFPHGLWAGVPEHKYDTLWLTPIAWPSAD